jgi:serine protease AprX
VTLNRGGGTASYTVTITPSGTFSSPVTFSISGLPSGASSTFSPNPATQSSVLKVTVASSVPKGTYTFTITGTGGSPTKMHTAMAKIVKIQKP